MEMSEKKEYSYFSHTKCEYFPCHKGADENDFNCLFCFCPLYMLGEECGGNFTYTKDGYKDCSSCLFPHKRENYDQVIAKYGQIIKKMKQK